MRACRDQDRPAGGNAIQSTQFTPGTAWQQVTVTFTADSTNMMRIHLYFSAGSGTIYYDDVQVQMLNSVGDTSITTHKFTGDERDSETNLDHTWFRQYSSQFGRWMHPDPAGLATADPSNPQSWNRYSYVLNNPLSAIDPLGLDCVILDQDNNPSVVLGDCPQDGNGSVGYYFDGTIDQSLGITITDNGDVVATLNDGSTMCSGSDCDVFDSVTVSASPLPPPDTGGGIDWSWWKGLATSPLQWRLPSTGAGSCLAVFSNSVQKPLKAVGGAASSVRRYVAPVLAAIPFGSAWLGSNISKMAAAGAVEAETAAGSLSDLAVVSTIATEAAPLVSKAGPYILLGGADAVLGYGVIKEGTAAWKGNCRP